MNYLKKLEAQIHQNPEKPALCDYEGAIYTYSEVAELIERYHIFFQTAGIKPGDKIAICARNSARWGILFFAVNTYEAVVVPILADFTASGATKLICHSDSVLLIADPEIWSQMSPEDMPLLRGVINSREEGLLWHKDHDISQAWADRDSLFEQCYPDGFNPQDVIYPGNDPRV